MIMIQQQNHILKNQIKQDLLIMKLSQIKYGVIKTIMTLLTILLQEAASPKASGYSSIIMMVALIAIFYFFMIRPQNKKQKEIANFRKSLQVNQKVITAGGIHGIIKEINDNDVVLEIASNVKIHIDKNSIFAAAADANSSQASK